MAAIFVDLSMTGECEMTKITDACDFSNDCYQNTHTRKYSIRSDGDRIDQTLLEQMRMFRYSLHIRLYFP